MSTEMKFDEASVGNALIRLLEHVAEAKDLTDYMKEVGIDEDFLYTTMRGLTDENMFDSEGAAFIMGVIVAWEAARRQVK